MNRERAELFNESFFFMKAAYYFFKDSQHPFFIKALYPVLVLIVLSLSLPQKEA